LGTLGAFLRGSRRRSREGEIFICFFFFLSRPHVFLVAAVALLRWRRAAVALGVSLLRFFIATAVCCSLARGVALVPSPCGICAIASRPTEPFCPHAQGRWAPTSSSTPPALVTGSGSWLPFEPSVASDLNRSPRLLQSVLGPLRVPLLPLRIS
jgi:hypothetical protein